MFKVDLFVENVNRRTIGTDCMFEDPFTSLVISLSQILLLHVLVTPINQRPFGWKYSDADKFIYDAFDRFDAQVKYNIGSFIFYTEKGVTYGYDGQSRLTTSILLLHVAKKYLTTPEYIYKINEHIFLDRPLEEETLTQQQEQIKLENGWDKFPRIQSYYENDFKALGNCLNGLPYEHESIRECERACDDFLRTKIPKEKLNKFIQFFLNNTLATKKDYKTPELAAKDMDIENNRGRQMSPLDNARNVLITSNTQNQYSVSNSLDVLRTIPKGIEMACMIYNQKIEKIGKGFINSTITHVTRKEDSSKFIASIDKVISFWNAIKDANNHRILCSRYSELSWNVLIPVAILNETTPDEYLKLAKKCMCYLVQHNVFSVNAFKDINPWITIGGTWISEKQYTLPALDTTTENDLYSTIHSNKSLPKFVARVYAHMLQSDAAAINASNVDIEHIIPQSTKQSYITRLGNLTLFEAKKPKDIPGLCGNRSLKNRPYEEKKLAYALSSVVCTHNIATEYPNGFGQEEVETRGRKIVQYILALKFE